MSVLDLQTLEVAPEAQRGGGDCSNCSTCCGGGGFSGLSVLLCKTLL